MPPRTPPAAAPDAVLRRRVNALVRAVRGAKQGEPKAIHKARVASRRVREALPVVLTAAPARKRRKLRFRVARVTRALGRVRELDVTLGLIDALRTESSPTAGLHALRLELERERGVEYARMRARLDGIDVRKLETRVRRALERGAGADELQSRAALIVRLTRRVETLEEALQAAGPLYSPEPIHAVRISTKKLRYAFELAHEMRLLRSRSVLPRLRRVQDTLGGLHDLQVLHERVDAARASASALNGVSPSLDELTVVLDERARQLHARFLASREKLRLAVDAALAEVASRAADGASIARADRPVVH